MPCRYAVLILALCSSPCFAQAVPDDATGLVHTRAKYDNPFARNLKSFNCAVKFSWKQHWQETLRVGDEGTDAEIEKSIQPIPNRVTVTQEDAILSNGMSEEQEHSLPRGGMAEGLLEHAVRLSLRTWLVASTNNLLPAPGSPVHFAKDGKAYTMAYNVKDFEVSAFLTQDLGLQSMAVKGSDGDRQEFLFGAGPQGLLLSRWTMGEDGNFQAGNHLIFNYTYQTVDNFQIPKEAVVQRESHHEVWHYTLTDCKVLTKSGS